MSWKTSPLELYNTLQVATVDDAINSKSPALVTMKAEYGETLMLANLTLFIIDAVKFFSIGKSMDADQVAQTAKLIAKDYYYLKPEDFKLCFDNAKRGKYGQLFDRLDGAVIFGWLEKYIEGRLNRSEEKYQEKHNENKLFERQRAQAHRSDVDNREKEFHRVSVQEFYKQNSKPPEPQQ